MAQRLSIVIPCHESAATLPQTLASLAAQTRAPDEVVIADDGSRGEATRALLARLDAAGKIGAGLPSSAARNSPSRPGNCANTPVRVLRLEQRGPGPARNAAVRASTGDLILPLDADDLLAKTALERLEGALAKNPRSAFAFSHVGYFGAVRGTAAPPRFNPYLELFDNTLVVTALLRREVYERHGCWYAEDLSGYEDWSFWLSVAGAGLEGEPVEAPLFRYRRKGAQGLLARDHARRAALLSELRQKHAALYARELELKAAHAPGLEILWSGPRADGRLASFLAGQSLDDVRVTETAFADAAALLHEARGKFLLWLSDGDLPLLLRAPPSFLEQAVRCAETHAEADAVVVPTDVPTLARFATRERLAPCPKERAAAQGDLVFLRTARAAALTAAHLPAGTPHTALAQPFLRRGRALLFAEDFFAQVPEPPRSPAQPSPAPGPDPLLQRAARRALPVYRRGRRLLVRLAGEERIGRALHPWKERALAASLALDALGTSLRGHRFPNGLTSLLHESARVERRLLDAVPVRFARRTPLTSMPGKGRVLLLLPSITTGGVERALLEMAATLSRDGYELIAATARTSRHEWAHKLRPHVRDLLLLGETCAEADQLPAVLQLARDRQISALFCVNSWLGLSAAEALREALPSVRTVDFQHTDFQTPGGDYARQSCLRYDRFLDLRLVSTDYLRRRYVDAYGVSPAKVRVIRAGVDESAFDPDRVPPGLLQRALGLPSSARAVLFIGRLVEDKDPVFVTRVFGALARREGLAGSTVPESLPAAPGAGPLHFVFLGEGPLRGQIEAAAAEEGIANRTHFLPADTPTAEALRDASLLLMASRIEGLPLVFFEALAMRVPVVSTAIEGIPELVTSDVGACVENAADPETRLRLLVDAAAPLLRDEARRREAGRRGRERIVTLFGAEATRVAYREAFAALLARQPRMPGG